MEKLWSRIQQLAKERKQHKYLGTAIGALAGVIVFFTTYALILPAITIERNVADDTPGIVLSDEEGIVEDLAAGAAEAVPENAAQTWNEAAEAGNTTDDRTAAENAGDHGLTILTDRILAGSNSSDGIRTDSMQPDDSLADGILTDGILTDDILADDSLSDGILTGGTLTDGILADEKPADGISAAFGEGLLVSAFRESNGNQTLFDHLEDAPEELLEGETEWVGDLIEHETDTLEDILAGEDDTAKDMIESGLPDAFTFEEPLSVTEEELLEGGTEIFERDLSEEAADENAARESSEQIEESTEPLYIILPDHAQDFTDSREKETAERTDLPEVETETEAGVETAADIRFLNDVPTEGDVKPGFESAEEDTEEADTEETTEQADPVPTDSAMTLAGAAGEHLSETVLASNGRNYRITVTYGKEAQIPDGARLEVHEIPDVTRIYQKYLEESADAIGETASSVSEARFFDISIVKNREKVQPAEDSSVQVKIQLTDLPEAAGEEELQPAHVVHFTNPSSAEVLENTMDQETAEADCAAVFETTGFSVFGVVYTVDFHWEVNGKTYDFSIPGGGFVSFTDLVEVLGIVKEDGNGDFEGEVDAENSENDGDSDDEFAGEVQGVDAQDVNVEGTEGSNSSLTLGDVEVSEKTRKFVADVESITFSTPSLLSVSKVEESTTVGAIKDGLGLECEYSAELTEEQIAKINAQTVEAGDWALISMKPFLSTEYLTVTMKNGDSFEIRVTDAQAGDEYGLHGKQFVITNSNRALKAQAVQGSTTRLQATTIASDNVVTWTFEYDESAFGGTGGYYLKTWNDKYLNITAGGVSLVDTKSVTGVDESGNPVTIQIASPLTVEFNESTGKYRISASKDGNSKSLTYSSDYYGVTDDQNTDGIWMQLRDPSDPSGKPGTVGTWDIIEDEISLKLFDYEGTVTRTVDDWEHGTWNDWEQKYYPGKKQQTDDIDAVWGSQTNDAELRKGTGVNAGRTIVFSGSGLGDDSEWFNQFTGETGKVTTGSGDDKKTTYSVLTQPGIVSSLLGVDNYPRLADTFTWQSADMADDGSLGYLFGNGKQTGVTSYTGVGGKGLQGLLRKDDKGYYYYDSESNYAYLDKANNEIILYSDTYKRGDSSSQLRKEKIGFFPFDEYNSNAREEKTPAGGSLHHQFGMSIESNFVYPDKGVVPDSGEDMIFEFSGDDDVWVFVDGVLLLDLGGVHQPVHGIIDFASGNITIDEVMGDGTVITTHNTTIDEMFQKASVEAGETKTFDRSEFSTHKFSFFYVERGGCDSNCAIKFNLLISKTLTVAKKLNGLTPTERQKYFNDEFLYELAFKHNSKGIHMEYDDENDYWKEENVVAWRQEFATYNTADKENTSTGNHTIKTFKDGTEETGVPIKDGHIRLKDGESMTITHLPRTDIFYLAEESQLDMAQFETPHAERLFVDASDQEKHEEEVHLHGDHAKSDGEEDWETRPYALMDTERLVYTNTLQEKNLEVKKEWKDNLAEHDPIQFELIATVDGEPYSTATGHDTINAQWTETRSGRTITRTEDVVGEGRKFKLSADNNWTIDFEHLPKMTEAPDGTGKEIVYSVQEDVPEGYSVTYEGPESNNLAYLDLFKFWPDDNSNHDGSTQEKKAEHISTYVKRSDGKYLVAEKGNNGEYFYSGVVNPDSNGNPPEGATKFELVAGTNLPSGLNAGADNSVNKQREMLDYAARISNVPLSEEVGGTTVSYTYEWDEQKDEDEKTKGLVLFTRPEEEVRILNSKGSVSIEKEWLDEDDKPLEEHPENITYSVYQLKHEHEWAKYDAENKEWTNVKTDGEGWYKISDAAWDEDGNPINGIEKRVCRFDSCSHYSEERTIVPTPCTEHDWGAWEVVKASTCTEKGERKRKCNVCHQTISEEIDALGHAYVETITKEATCTADGEKKITCSRCDYQDTVTVPASGHTQAERITSTCTEAGKKETYCIVCEVVLSSVNYPALDHDYGEWVDNGDGTHTKTCRRDSSHIVTEPIAETFPGTNDLYLVKQSDAWPSDNDTSFILQPSGIFKYTDGKYYVITDTHDVNASQFSGGPAKCEAAGWGSLIVQVQTDKILTSSDFTKNGGQQKDDLRKGDLYKDTDGTYYVFMNSGWGDKPTSTNHGNWYIVPNNVTTTNTTGSALRASRQLISKKNEAQTIDISETDENNGSGIGNDTEKDEESEETNSDGIYSGSGRKNVTSKNLTLSQLLADFNLEAVGQKNPATGDTLLEFKKDQTLETKDGGSNLVNGNTNLWTTDIPIVLDENGVEYRYYVVEDTPAIGGDYDITYSGQAQGLRDKGTVKISNKKEYTKLAVKKEWTDIDTVDGRHQGDVVKYTLYRIPKTDAVEYDPEEVVSAEGYSGELKYNVDSEKSWTEVITKLPKTGTVKPEGATDPIPVTYKYYVSEEPFDGYVSSSHGVTGDDGLFTVTITNEPQSPMDTETQIGVEKKWKDSNGGDNSNSHKNDSITFRVTQKRFQLRTNKSKTGDTSYFVRPVKIHLIDGDGETRQDPQIVYVPSGQAVTVTVSGNSIVRGHGFRKDDNIEKGKSDRSFKTNPVKNSLEVTLSLEKDKTAKWGEGGNSIASVVNPQNANWIYKTETELRSNVVLDEAELKSEDIKTFEYAMKLDNDGKNSIVDPLAGADGKGEGNGVWKGTITKLPLATETGFGANDKASLYFYTYEVTEVRIGTDDVNTSNPPSGFNGQTARFNVKWEQNSSTGTWEITNQEKPAVDFEILKVDKVTRKPLKNASFTIQKVKETSTTSSVQTDGTVKQSDPASTDDDGKAKFKGVASGYYQIKETKTPEGYVITGDDCFYIKVDGSTIKLLEKTLVSDDDGKTQHLTFNEVSTDKVGNVEYKMNDNTVQFTVENTPGAALPNTGGPGTTRIYLLGSMMLALGSVGLVMRRRRSEKDSIRIR